MTEIHLKHSDLRFTALNECTSENAPVVLCLHGFPDNNHSYDQQIPALVDAGYRVPPSEEALRKRLRKAVSVQAE
jgi:hypothetical protein